jgi:hypothetical protein
MSCLAAKYQNLWHMKNKARQLDNKIEFYLYKEMIRECIQDTPRIFPQLVGAYKPIARFMADHHHMYMQAKKYLREEWIKSNYKITEEDIHLIM